MLVSKPSISVLMSTYNASAFIDQSIESVLKQSFHDFEFIIIDDNSNDNTYQKLLLYAENDKRLRIHSNNRKRGLPANLNKMASLARAVYLARMDADDICHTNRFQVEYDYMQDNPSTAVCFSEVNLINLYGDFICKKWTPNDMKQVLKHLPYLNFLVHPSAMIRKSSFENIGGYNELFLKAQDWDLWKRMISSNMRLDIIRQVLLDYRLSETSNSASLSSSNRKSKGFQTANILIQNKNRFKALQSIKNIPLLEIPEIFVRLMLPMSLLRLMLKIRAKSKNSVVNKLLSQGLV
jgi:glycosyltransferase involved in cell wall biosynthesis